jgi:nitroreductase
MMSEMKALTDYPIHEFLAERWSPYAFENHPASEADLCLLFEAARWAASSYNEQPWSYIVSAKRNPELF